MALLFPALVAVAVLVIANWLKNILLSPRNLPPVYREFPYIPWLGSIYQFATGPREFLQRGYQTLGDIFTVNLFGTPMTFLMSSEGHSLFFGAREDVFDIREAYRCTVVTFGEGVVYDCPMKTMAQQLGFVKSGLVDERYKSYVPLIQHEFAEYFDRKWGTEGEHCLLEALSEVFTLTSSRCLLGPEIRKAWQAEFAESYRDLDHSFIPITFFFPNMPNPNRGKCLRARTMFEELFKDVIARRRESGEEHDDLLQVLMESRYKDGREVSIKEITGIMIATLLGGQHTSNVTGTWALCHLLNDEKWMEQIMEEQRGFVGDDLGAELTYAQEMEMSVFDKVLEETLRLHSPFFQLARYVKQDTEFRTQQGKLHVIPKGHLVAVSPGAAQRLPQLWGPEADAFRPERFEPEQEADRPKYAWIPFGGGKHQCSGRKFAFMSLKLGLAWLLRNYELELVRPEMPREDYTTMVVGPRAPVLVKYKRRL